MRYYGINPYSWFTKSENREARMNTCGTNHEPGSGSAFINYYLSVNTVCGTFVRDLSHTWMQRTWQGPEWILAITLHPTLPQTLNCWLHIYVSQHVLIIARIDCRYAKCGRYWWRNVTSDSIFMYLAKTSVILFQSVRFIFCVCVFCEIGVKRFEIKSDSFLRNIKDISNLGHLYTCKNTCFLFSFITLFKR